MKKIILMFGVALAFASCSTKTNCEKEVVESDSTVVSTEVMDEAVDSAVTVSEDTTLVEM